MQNNQKIIIGIHGLANKSSSSVLQDAWKASILEGLQKNLNFHIENLNFSLVYWADLLYPFFDENFPGYQVAKEADLIRYKKNVLDSMRTKIVAAGEQIEDFWQENFKTDEFVDIFLNLFFKDLFIYYHDENIRRKLQNLFEAKLKDAKGAKIFLCAHSMGSIIAFDLLKKLDQNNAKIEIEHFVSIGSPLGLSYVKNQILKKYENIKSPNNIKRWTNLSDPLDPVALDSVLNDDYLPNKDNVAPKDFFVLNTWKNYFHHMSYGYLRCPEFSDIVKEFLE